MAQKSVPHWIAVGGSDSSGLSGIESDAYYAALWNTRIRPALTAVTAQTPDTFGAIHPIPPEHFAQQLAAAAQSGPVAWLKSAMLTSADHIHQLAQFLESFQGHYVLDPVLKSTTGRWLLPPDALPALKAQLLPHAFLILPNRFELELLSGQKIATPTDALQAAQQLISSGVRYVLIKGGHFEGSTITDMLVDTSGPLAQWTHERQPGTWRGRGTCLAASITSLLTLGLSISEAIEQAIQFCQKQFFPQVR